MQPSRTVAARILAMPWLFAATYIVAIPSFALVYQNLWQELRQSTASTDPTTESLGESIRDEIAENLMATVPDGPRGIDPFFVQPVVLVSAGGDHPTKVVFARTATAQDISDPEADFICHVRYELELAPDVVDEHMDFGEVPTRLTFRPRFCAGIYFRMARDPENELDKFSWEEAELAEGAGTIDGTLYLERLLLMQLQDYVLARSSGAPLRVEGGFGRFLYFSVVTITTLGYGDIVPASDRARFVVASESILGVLVAGLFINAVALRSANKDA